MDDRWNAAGDRLREDIEKDNERLIAHEDLWSLVFEAAGAATAPLLEDNPEYVFPSERVSEAVRAVLLEHGYGPVPEGYAG